MVERRVYDRDQIFGIGLASPKVRADFNLNADARLFSVGHVRCVCAGFGFKKGSKELFCGSTLVNWGLRLGKTMAKEEKTLHEWYREARQRRYSEQEQEVLDALIERFLDQFQMQMDQLLPETETKQTYSPGTGHKSWSNQEAKEAKKAARELAEASQVQRPKAFEKLRKVYVSPLAVRQLHGQAITFMALGYDGRTMEFKKKCPVCTQVYTFADAVTDIAPSSNYFQDVAELDVNKVGSPRGCCAEAMIFVAIMEWAGLLDPLRDELHLLQPG